MNQETNESKFIKRLLADKNSYVLSGRSPDGKNDIELEYKIEKSQHQIELENLAKGKIRIPKWLAVIGLLLLVYVMIIFGSSFILLAIQTRDAAYQESCVKARCHAKLNLKCIEGTCKCNPDEFYTDKCTALLTYLESCASSAQCKQSLGLSCRWANCDCQASKYWNGSLCVDRVSYLIGCSGDQCLPNVGLGCYSGVCNCVDTTIYYWDGTKCELKKTYGGACSGLNNACLSQQGLICVAGTCQCNTLYYWDKFNTSCFQKKTEFQPCLSNSECLNPMFCSFLNQCECSIYKYFDLISSSCFDKKFNGSTCATSNECRTDLGLQCILFRCSCISPQIVLSTNQTCITPHTYGESCTISEECDQTQNLHCRTSTANPCNCPEPSIVGMCDCQKISGAEEFWDNSTLSCAAARDYNQSCPGNYACLAIAKQLECVSGSCNCPLPGGMLSTGNCLKCLSNFKFFGDYCYYVSTSTFNNFDDSKTHCENLNNTINTKHAIILNNTILNFVLPLTDNSSYYWVGAKDTNNPIRWNGNINIASGMCCSVPGDNGCDSDSSNNCLYLNSNPSKKCFDDEGCGTNNMKTICFHN